MTMFICTDDMCPKYIDMWKKYWDPLKDEFKHLHVCAFVIPKLDNLDKWDCSKSKEFKNWYESRKEWVSIALHGFAHIKKTMADIDGYQSLEKQTKIYTEGAKILSDFMPERWGFKPPFYRYTEDTFKAVKAAGGEWMAVNMAIPLMTRIYFGPGDFLAIPTFETHTNTETTMPDRIDRCHTELAEYLSNQNPTLNSILEMRKNVTG